ncbi:hypothetical protein [Rhodovulum euryhalinum]|uniref:Uncharacterized protein n=1 Tax=Rhodovulum euryhalinum TaxID=35805 RepID=A0A4R2KCC9_9RHOB|nr:hypothetical protein [Rhodovulum euryhalinum]TCO69747.1 hypothetical protein EV655_11332 [Rhodovulum euryhalinum]
MSPCRSFALAAALVALAPPLPAPAQQATEATDNDFALACAFVRECHETEPCAEADFALEVTGRVGGLGAGVVLARATLSSVAGDIDAFGTLGNGTLFLQGGNGGGRAYLVVTDGAARYTRHMAQGPVSVTYHGTCE